VVFTLSAFHRIFKRYLFHDMLLELLNTSANIFPAACGGEL